MTTVTLININVQTRACHGINRHYGWGLYPKQTMDSVDKLYYWRIIRQFPSEDNTIQLLFAHMFVNQLQVVVQYNKLKSTLSGDVQSVNASGRLHLKVYGEETSAHDLSLYLVIIYICLKKFKFQLPKHQATYLQKPFTVLYTVWGVQSPN